MTFSNFNNSIGFPRLANNSSSMLMTNFSKPVNANQQVAQDNKEIEQLKLQATILPPPPKDNTNYWLGALALAASAIAGIYIYKGRNVEYVADVAQEAVTKINHPHIKDNFLTALGKYTEDLEYGIRNEYDLSKVLNKKDASGNPIVIRHGIKRVEHNLNPVGLHTTTFETDDGKVLAEAMRNCEGEVVKYEVFDREGRLLRAYDNESGITRKFVYGKNGNLAREVQYDGKGWSSEIRYDSKGVLQGDKVEFGVDPNEIYE